MPTQSETGMDVRQMGLLSVWPHKYEFWQSSEKIFYYFYFSIETASQVKTTFSYERPVAGEQKPEHMVETRIKATRKSRF